MMHEDLVNRALRNKRESKYIEFKSEFDASRRSWCEVIKDIVAIANSGGGAIGFGLDSRGRPTGADVTVVLGLDPAEITDKIQRYTGVQFDHFRVLEGEKEDSAVAILVVGEARAPIAFSKPGTYPVEGGKQNTAFGVGTVYFRHGAKSEPATTEDLRRVLQKKVDAAREEWMKRVRRVVQAPPGYEVRVLPEEVRESDARNATPIRIVEDQDAPGYRKLDPDVTHPFRQTELVDEVNKRLPKGTDINTYDILAARRVHGTDKKAEFCHQPRFSSQQYSMGFVSWLVDQFNNDPHFFETARKRYYEMKRER